MQCESRDISTTEVKYDLVLLDASCFPPVDLEYSQAMLFFRLWSMWLKISTSVEKSLKAIPPGLTKCVKLPRPLSHHVSALFVTVHEATLKPMSWLCFPTVAEVQRMWPWTQVFKWNLFFKLYRLRQPSEQSDDKHKRTLTYIPAAVFYRWLQVCNCFVFITLHQVPYLHFSVPILHLCVYNRKKYWTVSHFSNQHQSNYKWNNSSKV